MGRRKQGEKQDEIWIVHSELASAPGHPFYQRWNELLEAERFDEFVEGRCARFYAEKYGRPSLTPGIYFRALLIGYFEGIGGGAGDCLAAGGLAGVAAFCGHCAGRVHPGARDDFAHAKIDRPGYAWRSVRLGVGRAGGSWVTEGPADRD
ncbi:MAG TPA: hypothetical protein VMS18_21220 [Candidatus Binatia bacterium]|nr:hypothetical protein [Candidatus Binatia bacterium]